MNNNEGYMGNWELKDYYSCLGEKGRAEFLRWLTGNNTYIERKHPDINYEYSVDYKDDVYRAGRNLVYLYTNELGVPFYVGEGTPDRAVSISSRNDSFSEKLNEYGVCRVFAIAHNIGKTDSLEVETLVINELLNRGWRLTNLRQTSATSDKISTLSDSYPDVLETINNITKIGLTSLLDDTDCFGETGKVVKYNKSRVGSLA